MKIKIYILFFLLLMITVIFFNCGNNENNRTSQNSSLVKFNKIIFQTTKCHGFCPVYFLQITDDYKAKLFAMIVYNDDAVINGKEDTSKMGYFAGKIDDTTMTRLHDLLSSCGIDTLTFPSVFCCDASVISILLYKDGKEKYLTSMFPPKAADALIELLYAICEKNNFQRTSEFKIDYY